MNNTISFVVNTAPMAGIVLFALPAYIGLLRQRGLVKALVISIALGVFALGIMTLVLKSGVPNGGFSFADNLGRKILGVTPWTIALAYTPVWLATFWLASKLSTSWVRVLLTAVFTVVAAVVLDPASVKLEFWAWEGAGPFYNVPITSFLVWLVAGLGAGLIMHKLWGKDTPVRASVAYSGVAIMLFWTGINIGIEQWISVGVGAILSLVMLGILITEKRQLRKEKSN